MLQVPRVATYNGVSIHAETVKIPTSGCGRHPFARTDSGALAQVCGHAGDVVLSFSLNVLSQASSQGTFKLDFAPSRLKLTEADQTVAVRARGLYQYALAGSLASITETDSPGFLWPAATVYRVSHIRCTGQINFETLHSRHATAVLKVSAALLFGFADHLAVSITLPVHAVIIENVQTVGPSETLGSPALNWTDSLSIRDTIAASWTNVSAPLDGVTAAIEVRVKLRQTLLSGELLVDPASGSWSRSFSTGGSCFLHMANSTRNVSLSPGTIAVKSFTLSGKVSFAL